MNKFSLILKPCRPYSQWVWLAAVVQPEGRLSADVENRGHSGRFVGRWKNKTCVFDDLCVHFRKRATLWSYHDGAFAAPWPTGTNPDDFAATFPLIQVLENKGYPW
jgi:hypothetical protein